MSGAANTSKHGIIIFGEPGALQTEFADLAKEVEVAFLGNISRPEAIEKIKSVGPSGKYDAVVMIPGSQAGRINQELLGPVGATLRYVGGIGAGYDTVEMSWLDSIGAWYANTPDSVSDFTAFTALTLIVQCIRRTTQYEATVRRGEWRKGVTVTEDPRGLVVGIYGMGTIGKLVRNKVQALGMRVIYNNRKRLPAEEESGATFVTFNELLEQSQLITINCPLTTETRHRFAAAEFKKMRKGMMIVNTSRGAVIDEEALVEALKSGQVDRAGLDVFENEPEIHPYLLTCEAATLYPHGGVGTTRLGRDLREEALANVRDWLATGRPKNGVNNPK